MEIMNEQTGIFKAGHGTVNFQNPYQRYLYLYSPSTATDDPSRDGGASH